MARLFQCEGSQRGAGVSILGDTEALTGHGPGQHAQSLAVLEQGGNKHMLSGVLCELKDFVLLFAGRLGSVTLGRE